MADDDSAKEKAKTSTSKPKVDVKVKASSSSNSLKLNATSAPTTTAKANIAKTEIKLPKNEPVAAPKEANLFDFEPGELHKNNNLIVLNRAPKKSIVPT